MEYRKGIKFYRKVLHTTKNMQLNLENDSNSSQFIRIESGKEKSYHNIIVVGDEDLHIYTVYTPPTHSKNTKQKNKS